MVEYHETTILPLDFDLNLSIVDYGKKSKNIDDTFIIEFGFDLLSPLIHLININKN